MCGIVGWVDFDQDLRRKAGILEQMTLTLASRGPDASGIWLSQRAALGHRRLVVIDPEGGVQPMVKEADGASWVITYNGELYNMEEVRRALLARGVYPKTRSDTELVLLAYMTWGIQSLERLEGIFAFGIWDAQGELLFLARDRLGVKPLFIWQGRRRILFASEMKALLAHPDVEPVVDGEGMAEILAMGPARTPGHGIFRHMVELRPGRFLTFSRRGIRQGWYWSLESRPHEDDVRETARTVRRLFRSAVRRQLVSDVPVATFLSGGLDSSAVSAVAAEELLAEGRGPLCTYAVDFEGQEEHFRPTPFQIHLDAPWAERMASHLKSVHTRVVLSNDALVGGLLPSLRARDLPGMADVDTSLMLFCRRIKDGATVALSGEAADEIFGGYPWCQRSDALAADTFPWARRLEDRLSILSGEARKWMEPKTYVRDRYQEALSEVPRLPGERGRDARIREVLYLNITRFLANLLERKDRMSMASGLEVRVPFCDHHLVDYVWNIPWDMKNLAGTAKGILRAALEGILPDSVRKRPKSPYPSTAHPAYGQAMRVWMEDILRDPNAPLLPLVDTKRVLELTRLTGAMADLPWFGQLMGVPQLFAYLIQVDAWLREYRVRLV